MEPGERSSLLAAIRKNTSRKIDFNHRFSLSYVDCGTGCGSFWFVDRRTGGVIEAPTSARDDEDTWDVRARQDSDTITVIYGPRDPVGAKCSSQHFRWSVRKFVPIDRRSATKCPG